MADADGRLTAAMALPDPAMLAPIDRLAAFIASGGEGSLAEVFAAGDVTILENFAPYLFTGADAVEAWTRGMRDHLVGLSELHHRFGQPQNFSRAGDEVFLSLPTEWAGRVHGKSFHEKGGWCFVLTKQRPDWRIRSYGWAVTELSMDA